jgi:pantetheine-phosphate adenylyltransferase
VKAGRATRRFQLAVLGGTFDRLHAGHRALLRAAFRSAGEVRIGLTTAAFLRTHAKPYASRIQSYPARRAGLIRFLKRQFPGRRWRVQPLREPFGGSVRRGPDTIVVTRETHAGARAVNRARRARGLPVLVIQVVPLVRDRGGRVYRSRRIRAATEDPRSRRSRTIKSR